MWIFSLITVILATAVKIRVLCHTVRDHYRCVCTSPLPPRKGSSYLWKLNAFKGSINERKSQTSPVSLQALPEQNPDVFIRVMKCSLFKDLGYRCRVL